MGPKILVGIPAYNEESTIGSVVERSLIHASSVVVVDDGSTDQTSSIALRSGATVISHQSNGGKGLAVASLFDYAIKERADLLVLLDGDGQHCPDEIPRLVSHCLNTNADVVVGSRFHRDAINETPKIRRIGQRAFNIMTYLASGKYCSDSQSGFRAFNRRAICAMRLTELSFSVESEMQFECHSRHLTISEVPISCSYDAPPKRNVFSHGLIVLTGLVSMAVQKRTLRNVPDQALPVAARTVLQGTRPGESKAFETVLLRTPGD